MKAPSAILWPVDTLCVFLRNFFDHQVKIADRVTPSQ
jgi:hypothetical protein